MRRGQSGKREREKAREREKERNRERGNGRGACLASKGWNPTGALRERLQRARKFLNNSAWERKRRKEPRRRISGSN